MFLARHDVRHGEALDAAVGGGTVPVAGVGCRDDHIAFADELLVFPFLLVIAFTIKHHQHLGGVGVVMPRVAAALFEKEIGGHLVVAVTDGGDVNSTRIKLLRSKMLC